ncbi:Uncharacterised protein [Streptococcus pneumoniae]|nr:Uncharacterised protein [Streptococcus pneumoniae]
MHRLRVVGVLVHTHHESAVDLLGGSGDEDLLGPGVEVGLRLGAGREDAGALDDQVHAELTPRQLRRVGLLEERDVAAVDAEPLLGPLQLARVAAQDGVVLGQPEQVLGVGEVVHRDQLEVLVAAVPEHAHDVASDAAVAVDGDLGHGGLSR